MVLIAILLIKEDGALCVLGKEVIRTCYLEIRRSKKNKRAKPLIKIDVGYIFSTFKNSNLLKLLKVERDKRIELLTEDWKSAVLPLN